MTDHDDCHETVDQTTREQTLERYDHRCQACGRCGPGNGGLATLHVHHLQRDPADMGEHDPANLTVLCRSCHAWQHQQPTDDDVPVSLTEADRDVLLAQDLELLRVLADIGPATTGDVAAALTTDLTVMAVRERLWTLMGLDNMVASREEQIVDQDAETDEWGLTDQISNSARGHIPSDPHLLVQRVQDECVRQALGRDCARATIAEVFDISQRTTFYREKRAHAYDFPLAAIDKRNGGRPAVEESDEEGQSGHAEGSDPMDLETATETSSGPDSEPEPEPEIGRNEDSGQLELASMGAADGEAVDVSDGVATETTAESAAAGGDSAPDTEHLREHIQQALTALEKLDAAL